MVRHRAATTGSASIGWGIRSAGLYEKYLNNLATPPATALTGGTVSFTTTAGLAPGQYNIRLNTAAGATVATSATITVTATSTVPGISLSTTNLAAGGTLSATITNAPGTSRYDWVGFYPVGNTIGGYAYYKYLNDSLAPPASPMTGGTVTFLVTLPAGLYNVRLNTADGTTAAASATVTVTSSAAVSLSTTTIQAGDTVTATIANGSGVSLYDWVGFYPVGNSVGGYIYMKYLNNSTTPPLVPMTGGTVSFATLASLPPGSTTFDSSPRRERSWRSARR